MDRVLSRPGDAAVQAQVRADVHDLCQRFPLYDFTVAAS
jgi:glycine hydroxymethyltransferase